MRPRKKPTPSAMRNFTPVSGTRLDTIMDKLDSIALDLTALKEKPSKRWETVVAALITGAIGYLLASIGIG